MGLSWSSKSSGSTSALGPAEIAILGGTQLSLTLLEKMMDGVPIPFVKAAAGTAVEVIKIAKLIRVNRDDCDELLRCSSSLLVVILGSYSGYPKASIPDHLISAVNRLTSDFETVLAMLREIDTRTGKKSIGGTFRAIVYHYDNAEKLKGCSVKLAWAMQEFQVISKIGSCLKALERHEELQKDLREGHAEILAAVKDAMKDQTITDVVSSFLSTVMPADPRIFGRHEYVESAVRLLLSSDSSRLAILGPCGMGKTSVSLKIIHHAYVVDRFGRNRHWVACEQATSITFLIELLAKSLKLPTSISNDRFGDVVDSLESSKVPHLFLFDNFETPWDIEGQQSVLGEVLTRISAIPLISFILTMRGNQLPYCDSIEWSYPPLPPLTKLELAPAEEAFVRISPDSIADPELHTLLRQLDCVPLAITLMAKLARSETISQLLSQWESEQTGLLSEPGGDRRTSIEVSIKLSLESRSVKGNEDAVNLLGIVATLPGGASIHRLSDICPSIPKRKIALRVLLDAALIYYNPDKSFVQVLSPIRAYILLHYPIGASLLQDLQKAYFRLAEKGSSAVGKPDFLNNVAELVEEETNMDAILLDGLHSTSGEKSLVIRASLDYSKYLYWTQPRTNIIKVAEQVARDYETRQHASCLQSLGDILRMQTKYEAAYAALEEAKAEYTSLGDRLGAANCRWSLGDILQRQTKYEAAHTTLEEAKAEHTSLGNRQGAADCLQSLGDILRMQTRYEEACTALKEAEVEYTNLGDQKGAAGCLWSLGDILRMQNKYEDAYTALEEAKAMYTSLGNRQGAANCLWSVGDIFRMQTRYEEACTALEGAKAEYTSLGDQLGVANCLWSLGDTFQMQTRYETARTTLEQAKAAYISLGDQLGAANCLWSLGAISQSQLRYSDALNHLEEARATYAAIGISTWLNHCVSKLDEVRQLQVEALGLSESMG